MAALPLEPLLGHGIRLPQPLGALRLFSLIPKVPDNGTVLILHGMEEDWLGNSDGGPVPGGATEIAQLFREAGFTAVLVDSFFDGRRDRLLQEGLDRRVSDILAAIVFIESRNFPLPIHLYGKSEGAWAVLRLLAAPAARGHPLVAREAVWAIGRLSTCICNLEGMRENSDPEEESLLATMESVETSRPPMLLLSNGSEGAARRIARAVAPGVETVEESEVGKSTVCRVVGHVNEKGNVQCILRCYADESASTAFRDGAEACLTWLRQFAAEIWVEAEDQL